MVQDWWGEREGVVTTAVRIQGVGSVMQSHEAVSKFTPSGMAGRLKRPVVHVLPRPQESFKAWRPVSRQTGVTEPAATAGGTGHRWEETRLTLAVLRQIHTQGKRVGGQVKVG